MKPRELRKGKGVARGLAALGQAQTSEWWGSFCCPCQPPLSPRQSRAAQRGLVQALQGCVLSLKPGDTPRGDRGTTG